jgi:putative nucleotidyltransferase with HDIG domain
LDVLSTVSGGSTTEAFARRSRRRALDLATTSGGELREHARRVARYALAVADGLGLDDALRLEVELAALLHDVGKAALPMGVLAKPSPLDDQEWALMRIHTVEGERMVRAAGFGAELAYVVRATHERWDGAGYPDGLSGRAVPFAARIVFTADAYDAMTAARPYRPALPAAAAVRELRRGAGTQFDPIVAIRLAAVIDRLEGRFRRTPRDRDPRAGLSR